jgi:hypothetical protein
MPKYRKVDADVMKKPVKRKSRGRPISSEQQALIKRMKTITDETVVYESVLSGDEKLATVRQQLLRAAKLADVEIAVKKSEKGFYFGLMTPERKSNRGRKPNSTSASKTQS